MTNTMTFDTVLQKAKDLGAEAGKGKDTQIKFLLTVIEGGYHNKLDLAPHKHGTDKDDATVLAEAYVTAQGGSTIFDTKAGNTQKLISCMRTGIKLGAWPKGGSGEPLATVNNLVQHRQTLRKDPAQRSKLDDAFNAVMKFARVQLKRDLLLADDEWKQLVYKKPKEYSSAEQIVENIQKQLTNLINGKAASGTAQDNSTLIRAARQACNDRLAEIARARAAARGPNPDTATVNL